MKNATLALLFAVSAALGWLLYRSHERAAVPTAEPYAPVRSVDPVRAELDALRAAAGFTQSEIGLCLIDESGAVVFADRADTAMIPASAFKTLTSAAALDALGPSHVLTTGLYTTAPFGTDGILAGDLVIRGGGDPMFESDDFQPWVATLSELGLKQIRGRIIGDASYFDDALAGEHWNWGDVGNGYGSPVAGLNLNHNRFVATIQPGSTAGSPAKFLGSAPAMPGIEWNPQLTTGPEGSGDGVMIFGGPFATVLTLKGTVPAGSGTFAVTGAVPNPALLAAAEFDRMLRASGIDVTEPPEGRYAAVSAEDQVAEHMSPPLLEIVRSLHATSDNLETECLFKLLGKTRGRPPAEALRDYWTSQGLDLSGTRIVDGSGLSRANFIPPVTLARAQHVARMGRYGDAYYDSLLATGDGRLRVKGGAMSGVRTYAGFIRAASGRELAFALMINHFQDAQDLPLWRDRIFSAIVREF